MKTIEIQHTDCGRYEVREVTGSVFDLDGSYRNVKVAGPFRTRREAVRAALKDGAK